MLRRMLITTTALVAVTGTALAASMGDDAAKGDMTTYQGDFLVVPAVNAWTGDNVTGLSVYENAARDSDPIGEINDVVLMPDGQIEAAIIGVGGFLGIGEKEVAVRWDSLDFEGRDQNQDGIVDERFVVFPASRDMIEAAPAFERDAHQEASSAAVQSDQMQTPHDVAARDMTDDAMPGAVQPSVPRESMTLVGYSDVRAADLLGLEVYSYQNDPVGEIGDLIVNDNGRIDAIVIDFGGFLGVGEKEVAVGFESVEFRANENGDVLFVYTGLTREELETAPAYDEAGYSTHRDDYRVTGERSSS